MEREIDYLPFIEVSGVRHNLLAVHVSIDFGGRQLQCDFQSEMDERGKRACFSKVYYPLMGQWEGNDWPTNNILTRWLHDFIAAFDTTGLLTKAEAAS